VFTFYNSELYRIFVIYDRNRTQGLSADDLIDSISAVYGNPTRPAAIVRTGSSVLSGFNDEEKVNARWQDLRFSVNLFALPTTNATVSLQFRSEWMALRKRR
jgi:hypothetical protein